MKYISLKEAASMSGYSSDYIGQLIRAGKLEGKQVFSNVSWVTTEEAIHEYLNKNKKVADDQESFISRVKTKIASSEGLSYAHTAVSWIAIGLCVCFVVVLIGLAAISIDHHLERSALDRIHYVQ
jgi:hypothetical protein